MFGSRYIINTIKKYHDSRIPVICLIFLIGCGKSNIPATVTKGPQSGQKIVYFNASRNGNTASNGVYVENVKSRAYIPLHTAVVVTQNTSQPFSVTIVIRNVTCNYTHNGRSPTMNNVVCDTANNYVDLDPNDSILVTINPGVTGFTSIQTSIVIDF